MMDDKDMLHILNKDGEKLLFKIHAMSLILLDLIDECDKTYKLARTHAKENTKDNFMYGLAHSRLFGTLRKSIVRWIQEYTYKAESR